MEFSELINKRYSVRAYRPDPVSEDVLCRVLEAARLAPTAANRQPFALVVVHTANRQSELRPMYHREWLYGAPLIVCMCALPAMAWTRSDGKNYADIDATIAMDHLVLAAVAAGLGTCWVSAFDPLAVRRVLGLPEGVSPIALTPLGYPADQPRVKERRPLTSLVHYERW